jgi:hypothetical protein
MGIERSDIMNEIAPIVSTVGFPIASFLISAYFIKYSYDKQLEKDKAADEREDKHWEEISNGILTRRVDSDGSVLPTPITTQITMPSIPTTEGANTISVDTTVQPSEFTATWTGWHELIGKVFDGTDWI